MLNKVNISMFLFLGRQVRRILFESMQKQTHRYFCSLMH